MDARGRVYDAYDAREGTDISDDSLVRIAIKEGRVLLTSDRGFLERKPVRGEEVLARCKEGRNQYRAEPAPVASRDMQGR